MFQFSLPVLKNRIFKGIAYERVGASCCSILSILHGRCIFPALPDLPLCFSSWFVNIMLNARHEGAVDLPNRSDGWMFFPFQSESVVFTKVETSIVPLSND